VRMMQYVRARRIVLPGITITFLRRKRVSDEWSGSAARASCPRVNDGGRDARRYKVVRMERGVSSTRLCFAAVELEELGAPPRNSADRGFARWRRS